MNIVSRFLPFIVCTQSHTGASSCLSLGAGPDSSIRRGSAPFWCGGSPRSWGCGGDKPRDILSTQPGSSGPTRRFPEKSASRTGDSGKYPAQLLKILKKRPARDPAFSPKDRPHPPTSKKIGRPLPPTVRFAKKLIGPIDFKTGRGDLFYSSIITCASTGTSDETGWSVRSFSKPIGPANFRNDRGDPQDTRITGSPPLPPLHAPQKN